MMLAGDCQRKIQHHPLLGNNAYVMVINRKQFFAVSLQQQIRKAFHLCHSITMHNQLLCLSLQRQMYLLTGSQPYLTLNGLSICCLESLSGLDYHP